MLSGLFFCGASLFQSILTPGEQRRNSRDGYNSFQNSICLPGGRGGGNVYLIKIKTEMKKHKVLFATSHANKGLNRTHHLQFHGVRTKKSLASIPRVSLGSVPVNIPGDWD